MLNQVTLIGRTTRDCELRKSANGTDMTFITVAIDGIPNKEGKKTTNFINVSLFGTSAAFAANYVHKGDMVQITGEITSRSVAGADGKNKTELGVRGTRIENLSPRKSGDTSKTDTTQEAVNESYDPALEDDGLVSSDDLPF